MSAVLATVNVTSTPTLVYGAQGSTPSPLTIINLSSLVTVYIGNVQNISIAGTNVTPLAPGASLSFDGSVSIYAIAGVPMQVSVVPGGVSYSPGPLAAVPVFTVGSFTAPATPPLVIPAASVLFAPIPSSTAILNGPYAGLPVADMTAFNSYDISMFCYETSQRVNTTGIRMIFFDDLNSGIPVYEEDYWIWVNSTNVVPLANPMSGAGALHGRYMGIVFDNLNQAPSGNENVSYNWFTVYGSSRPVTTSDWRQNTGVLAIAGANNLPNTNAVFSNAFNLGNFPDSGISGAFDSNLGSAGFTMTGPNNYIFPLPLFQGTVSGEIDLGSPTMVANIFLRDARANFASVGWTGARTLYTVLEGTGSDQVNPLDQQTLGRSPSFLVIQTTGTTSFEIALNAVANSA